MNLRQQAAADLATIVEDVDGGFGWPIVVTPPIGLGVPLVGLSSDVATMIDPETGQAVSGRTASVAIRMGAFEAAGLDIPRAIHDERQTPWIVEFDDILGKPHRFKVCESKPDRALGLVVLILEGYD